MNGKGKVIIISAGVPLVLLIALTTLVVLALGQVSKSGAKVMDVKADNYTLQSQTAKQGQTVFLGDSITEYYPISEFYASYTEQTGTLVYNRGISAEVTAHMLERLEDNVLCMAPKNLVILIGTNDIGEKISQDDTYNNICTIIERVQAECPDTNIILQGIYPVNENMKDFYNRFSVGSRTNEKIAALNQRLEQLANEKGVAYLDLTADLCNDIGDFDLQYTYDGLHPSAAGYKVITERILPLLK